MPPQDTDQEPTLHAGELPEHLPLLHQLRSLLLGKALSSAHMENTLLSKIIALPVFSSDAISSVAYATQEIVLVMGAAGLWSLSQRSGYAHYTLLVSGLIVALLIIVVSSYWQTIFAYPSGGGSYIVSKENLGTNWSLIAAGALLIDYVLTVSVSVASGVQNLSSVPFLVRFHPDPPKKNTVLILVGDLNQGTLHALNYGKLLSPNCRGVHVEIEPNDSRRLQEQWPQFCQGVPLTVLPSPYRSVARPLKSYIAEVNKEHEDDFVTIVIPEAVPEKWWQQILHGQVGLRLKLAFLGHSDIIVSNVRYRLERPANWKP